MGAGAGRLPGRKGGRTYVRPGVDGRLCARARRRSCCCYCRGWLTVCERERASERQGREGREAAWAETAGGRGVGAAAAASVDRMAAADDGRRSRPALVVLGDGQSAATTACTTEHTTGSSGSPIVLSAWLSSCQANRRERAQHTAAARGGGRLLVVACARGRGLPRPSRRAGQTRE